MHTQVGTTLDSETIRFLRKAHVVSFHYVRDLSFINATCQTRTSAAELKIDCELSTRSYTRKEDGTTAQVYQGFAYRSSCQYDEYWQTIAKCLRPGDVLRIVWTADGLRNQYAEQVGMHCDCVALHVMRKGKRALAFKVDSSINPGNTARLVQTH